MQVFPCPFCKKEIQLGVDICGWCETSLATGLVQSKGGTAPYTGDQVIALVDALERWRNSPEEDPKDPKRPFNRHWFAFIVPAAIFILGRYSAPDSSLFPLLLITGLPTLVMLIVIFTKSRWITPSRCSDPRKAVEMFLNSVSNTGAIGQAYTHWLASPDKSSRPRETPQIPGITEPRVVREFSTQEGFIAYWRHLLDPGLISRRRTEFRVGMVQEIVPGYAAVDTSIRFLTLPEEGAIAATISPLLAQASMKEHWLNFSKLLIQRKGRWWVANGEADDTLDQAIAQVLKTRASSKSN